MSLGLSMTPLRMLPVMRSTDRPCFVTADSRRNDLEAYTEI